MRLLLCVKQKFIQKQQKIFLFPSHQEKKKKTKEKEHWRNPPFGKRRNAAEADLRSFVLCLPWNVFIPLHHLSSLVSWRLGRINFGTLNSTIKTPTGQNHSSLHNKRMLMIIMRIIMKRRRSPLSLIRFWILLLHQTIKNFLIPENENLRSTFSHDHQRRLKCQRHLSLKARLLIISSLTKGIII